MAEQTKSDKVENVGTGGVKIEDFGGIWQKSKFEERRDGWNDNWNSWKV